MPGSTYILGINGPYHDLSACVLRDGELVVAVEEERLSRCKHGKEPTVDTGDVLPELAIDWCLRAAGIEPGEVDHVAYPLLPDERRRNADWPDRVREGDWGSESGEDRFRTDVLRVPARLRTLGVGGTFHWLAHHECHAASAFYPSPFAEAAVLTVDGIGELASTTISVGEGDRLTRLAQVDYPHSIGFVWEKVSELLGFGEHDAAKVMGLAAYGDPDRARARLDKVIATDEHGFVVDTEAWCFRSGDFGPIETALGLRRRASTEPLGPEHADLAAALQDVTNDIVLHLAERAHALTGHEALCLAGGVALNCVTNRHIFEDGPFRSMWIQPAASDSGTAIGGAHLVWSRILGRGRGAPMAHAFTGPEYDEADAVSALQAAGLEGERVDDIEERVAELLSQGALVGWFQGRSELGPRALGNRSLLADPRVADVTDCLNRRVKHREPFRPFAPSVLAEHARSWFQIERPTEAAAYMLVAYPATAQTRELAPAVVHVDGTSRVQVVERDQNPRYHGLISAFYRRTGVPIVLNTSFNDSEPIVCSPADAVRTFVETGLDHLAMGDLLVTRRG